MPGAAAPTEPIFPATADLTEALGTLPSPDDLLSALNALDQKAKLPKRSHESLSGVALDSMPVGEVLSKSAPEVEPEPTPGLEIVKALKAQGLDQRAIESFLLTVFLESKLGKKLASQQVKIINGRIDDRYDPPALEDLDGSTRVEFEAEVEASRAVAILVNVSELDPTTGQPIMPPTETLTRRRGLCAGQRFGDQPTIGPACSAVLVRDDLVATAGHCVGDIKPNWAVFDYRIDNVWKQGLEIPRVNAHRVSLLNQGVGGEDLALYRLDPPVRASERTPVKIRAEGLLPYVSKGERVFSAGHPDGLPLKIVLSGTVLRRDKRHLVTNLDLFQGNSGSPVFSRLRGPRELVGIVVSGREDYVPNGNCEITNHCISNGKNPCAPDEAAVNAHFVADALAKIPR